jgi:tetratricopeptide (TPR) repeat protein
MLLLPQPDSPLRRTLQGRVYLAAGDWRKFTELVENSSSLKDKAEVGNNLGVSYLALSTGDASYLLKALTAFKRAAELDPAAPEPLFNLVVTYRSLRFPKLAEEALRRYSELDATSQWHSELVEASENGTQPLFQQLQEAIKNNRAEAERLFTTNAKLYWRLAMQQGLSARRRAARIAALHRGPGNEASSRCDDCGNAGASVHRPARVESRRCAVSSGMALTCTVKASLFESLSSYAEAAQLASKTKSVFDLAWVELNKADSQIRMGQFEVARSNPFQCHRNGGTQ